MSGLEQAIRNALDRAERSNPEIRARIYQSARNALDTGMRKQEIDDAVVIERQRQRLEMTIRAIEDEELEKLRMAARLEKIFIESQPFEPEPPPAAPEVIAELTPVETASPQPDVTRIAAPATEAEQQTNQPVEDGSLSDFSVTRDERRPATAPRSTGKQTAVREAPKRTVPKQEPVLRDEEDPSWAEPSTPEGRTVLPRKRQAKRRSGSWIVSLFVYCVLIGIVAFGVWWVYATGIVGAALQGTGNFDFIPKELQSEDYDPKAEQKSQLDPLRGFSGEWVDIFKPGESERLKPSSAVKIGDVTDSDGKAITVASSAPDQDGELRIEVPAAILQDLAGKTSTIALTLRADGDVPSQIYIQCEFTTLGDCGRHRFTVSNERADELIQVKFDGKLGPSDPGYVVINSDLSGEGKAIRLYGIRVLPGS